MSEASFHFVKNFDHVHVDFSFERPRTFDNSGLFEYLAKFKRERWMKGPSGLVSIEAWYHKTEDFIITPDTHESTAYRTLSNHTRDRREDVRYRSQSNKSPRSAGDGTGRLCCSRGSDGLLHSFWSTRESAGSHESGYGSSWLSHGSTTQKYFNWNFTPHVKISQNYWAVQWLEHI